LRPKSHNTDKGNCGQVILHNQFFGENTETRSMQPFSRSFLRGAREAPLVKRSHNIRNGLSTIPAPRLQR
jgi:hypothetical protein